MSQNQPANDHLNEEPTQDCCGVDLKKLRAEAEAYARKEPLKAAGFAFGLGLILSLVPAGSLVVGITRLLVALVRPILVVLGAIRIFEELDRRRTPAPEPQQNTPSASASA